MTNPCETGDRAIWLEAVTDPQLVADEERVGQLSVQESGHYRLGRELHGYFWNSGVPYTATDNILLGYDEKSTFAQDRPAKDVFKRGRFVNDERQRGRVLDNVNGDVKIIQKDGKQLLVGDKKRVLSPKFDRVVYTGDNLFEVTSGKETGVMKLLSSEEQEAVLEKRVKHDEHRGNYNHRAKLDLQYEIAIATLALHDVSLDPAENRKHPNSNFQQLCFNHAGNHVLMDVGGSFLSVMSWDEELTLEQRHEVWGAYNSGDNSVRSVGTQMSIMMRAIDRGVPDSLKPYEDRIIAEIDEITAANKLFLAAMRELFERNNFRPFSIGTPHTSWSIPVAMKLLEMPFDEAFPIIAPFGSSTGGSIKQVRPGAFSSHHKDEESKVTWVLDDASGEVKQQQLPS